MKLAATSRFRLLATYLSLALVFEVPCQGKMVECADPPGPRGSVTCSGDNIPVCRSEGNRLEAECIENPTGYTAAEKQAKFLSRLLGISIYPSELASKRYGAALKVGRIRQDGAVITFNLDLEKPSVGLRDKGSSRYFDNSGEVTCTACLTPENGIQVCATATSTSLVDAKRDSADKVLAYLDGQLTSINSRPLLGRRPEVTCQE